MRSMAAVTTRVRQNWKAHVPAASSMSFMITPPWMLPMKLASAGIIRDERTTLVWVPRRRLGMGSGGSGAGGRAAGPRTVRRRSRRGAGGGGGRAWRALRRRIGRGVARLAAGP